MQTQYQGRDVTVVRDARAGDVGFDLTQGRQVLVTLYDGTTIVVLREHLREYDQSSPHQNPDPLDPLFKASP